MAMTDARLAKMAADYYEAHQQEKAGKATKQKIAAKMLPDLKARGVKAIDLLGWKITNVIQHYTVYDAVKARRVLGKERFIAVTKRVIDPDLLAQALSDGVVTDREIGKFSERKEKANYASVVPSEASE